ncbi:MAG: hypothetical protein AAGC64_02720 [Bacteroidota bacterium]
MWLKKIFGGDRISIKNLNNSSVTIIKKIGNLSLFIGDSGNRKLIGNSKKSFTTKDRRLLVGEAPDENHVIPRKYLVVGNKEGKDGETLNGKNFASLQEALLHHEKYLLIGGPGLGKSFELKKLAIDLINDLEDEKVPVFRSLRNFNITTRLETFIGIDLIDWSKVILLLDGVDEVANAQDFISKLEIFLENISYSKVKLEVILSCRTNIFNSSVKKIEGFQEIQLEELEEETGRKHLEFLLGQKLENTDLQSTQSQLYNELLPQFLTSPYLIRIILKYIKDGPSTKANVTEVWKHYIKNRILEDGVEKFLRKGLDFSLLEEKSKELSLLNELRKLKVVSDSELSRLFTSSSDFKSFKHNPLLEYDHLNGTWSFEHANIQEYFAAQMLKQSDSNKAIEFIQVEKTGKTHPSLFNTIGFLTNLLDPKDSEDEIFLKWIIGNEPDLMIQSDHTKWPDEIRVITFQSIFFKDCIEDGLWIGQNRNYTISQLATFASCQDNFIYLLDFFEDLTNHFRIRHSSLEVLAKMQIPSNLKEKFINALKKNLVLDNVEYPIKALIISSIRGKQELFYNGDLIEFVFDTVGDWDNNSVRRNILEILFFEEYRSIYFEILFSEFLLSHEIESRKDKSDKVLRGNAYLCQKLVLQLEDYKKLLRISAESYASLNASTSTANHQFLSKLTERCMYFHNKHNDFLIVLVKTMIQNHGVRSIRNNKYVNLLVTTSGCTEQLFEILIKNEVDFMDYRHFFGKLVVKNNLPFFQEKVYGLNLNNQEIERFRNIVSHNKNGEELSLSFQSFMQTKGIEFETELLSYESKVQELENFKTLIRNNIEILLEPELIENETRIFFELHKIDELSSEKFHEIENSWFDRNGYESYHYDPVLNALSYVIRRRKNSLKILEISKFVTLEETLLHALRTLISRIPNQNLIEIIGKDLLKKLKDKIDKIVSLIDFNDVIRIHNVNSISHTESHNHSKIESIVGLKDLLGIELSVEFYLNRMQILGMANAWSSTEAKKQFEETLRKVKDLSLINKMIVHNLQNKTMFSIPLLIHASYAIGNQLEVVYEDIENLLLRFELPEISKNDLKQFVIQANKLDLLKKCCVDPNRRIFWNALKIMLDLKLEEEFLKTKAKSYIEEDIEGIFFSSAIKILMAMNDSDVIEYLIRKAKVSIDVGQLSDYQNFDSFNNLDDIEELYFLAYHTTDINYESHSLRKFLETLTRNLARKDQENYELVTTLLNKIKANLLEKEMDIFFISYLLRDCQDAFVTSKSKPLRYSEAKSKVLELI